MGTDSPTTGKDDIGHKNSALPPIYITHFAILLWGKPLAPRLSGSEKSWKRQAAREATYNRLRRCRSQRKADDQPARIAHVVELGRDDRMRREEKASVGIGNEDT
jgi:hypothetical protein